MKPDNQDWTFDTPGIASTFENHLSEQLPWIEHCYELLFHIGRHYLCYNAVMYDIGASTGNVTRTLADLITRRNVTATSIEMSVEMCSVWNGVGSIINEDVLTYEFNEFDFAVCFLTIMFLPVADRGRFVKQLYDKLKVGGAIFILDKVQPTKGYVGLIMQQFATYQKIKNGILPELILEKEMSLCGIQRPIDSVNLFSEIPFVQVFQMGNFAGWVLTKE